MSEVLPFECEHEDECRSAGVEFSIDCPRYCGLYKEKKADAIEEIATATLRELNSAFQLLDDSTLDLYKVRVEDICVERIGELKKWGVEVL